MAPAFYDPDSPDELPVQLPSATLISLDDNIVLQPPLTRRGTGPGLIVFLPTITCPGFTLTTRLDKPLDPEPVQKWSEEGFAVVGVYVRPDAEPWLLEDTFKIGVDALLGLSELDTRDEFAVIVYVPEIVDRVLSAVQVDSRLCCLITYSLPTVIPTLPVYTHLTTSRSSLTSALITTVQYPCASPYFVLPNHANYHPGSASMAHSRSLAFLKKHLGGPIFDIEQIWEEHTYFEFEVRSVAKTMGTMVAEPYVNHVPTMTGGVGRQKLTAFYRDNFIFSNPADTVLQPVSRTVGPDRVVDEFIFRCTHDRTIDWLLPGVPPTNKVLAIPMLGVINVRGDRLYHEHIWWDQGTVMLQAGIIPSHVAFPLDGGQQNLRLPVAGAECARLLVDETDGTSNEMIGPKYGIQGPR